MIFESSLFEAQPEIMPMTLAIETHQLTRFFDDFCAVRGIAWLSSAEHFTGSWGQTGRESRRR